MIISFQNNNNKFYYYQSKSFSYKKEIESKQNVREQKSDDTTTVINDRKEMDLLAKLICKTPEDDRRRSVVELKFDFLSNDIDNNDKSMTTNDNGNNSIQIIGPNEHNNEQLIKIIHDLEECSLVSNDQDNHAKPTNNQTADDDIDLLELMDS